MNNISELNPCKSTFLFLAAILLYSAGLNAQQQKYFMTNGRSVDIAAFNADMTNMIREIGVPAISLAIIDSDQVVFSGTYGYREMGKKIIADENTVFEAASLTKMFLLFVVQQLVQEGAFDLNKPMYQYLEYPPLEHDPRYKLITPRMILSHSSGIENWKWEHNKDTLEIVSNPGEKFVYSGEGYQYLAKVIEKVLHQSYEHYIDERVLQPLGIKKTYLKYSLSGSGADRKEIPSDYAIGYNDFEEAFKKTKDTFPVPASGAQTTAGEYAKLILAMFNGKYLSQQQVRNMLLPIVRVREDRDEVWMGSGFSEIYTEKDTIISFSGSNPGFKSEIFYSVPHKRGFIFLTNGDRGDMVITRLNKMSAVMNIDFLFAESYYEQYPSTAIHLFQLYREKNAAAMFAAINRLKKEGKLPVNTLNELGDTFMGHDKDIARKLLEENIALYPDSSVAYGLLGSAYLEQGNYEMAYKNLKKARELHFGLWDITLSLKKCEEKITPR
ncbi:MAG TPA: serine hydrolase [Puia sp.]|nr:serine hydrolase [Puia sp.]